MTGQTGRLVGYARVSTKGQDTTPQLEALEAAGVQPRDIFEDAGISGSTVSRPGFDRMLQHLQDGDTLVVWKLDRLGRNAGHVITTLQALTERGVQLKALSDGLDTTTPTGRAMLGMLAILANLERDFALERTRHALASKAERGIKGGRPRALTTRQARLAVQMADDGDRVVDIASVLKTSVPTVYRYLAAARAEADAGTPRSPADP